MRSNTSCALIFAAACLASAGVGRADEIRDAVDAGNRAFVAAFSKGDAAALAQLYTEDAKVIAPGEPVASGRASIAAAWQRVIEDGARDLRLETADVEAAGDLACETGIVKLAAPDGTAVEQRYVVVWKREGGRWKLHRDIWNSGP
jgi:uncharacterized protein (TIGR02246 family)